jgi:hypothetical protein
MTYITRLQRAGVSPREAMELARHSDMRLTMKTYTDAAQLPLAATVRGLPAFDDSQIDSQTLVADRPAVSPSVIGLKTMKIGRTVENIDESRNLTPVVAICHSEQISGDLGFESPSLRQFFAYFGDAPAMLRVSSMMSETLSSNWPGMIL